MKGNWGNRFAYKHDYIYMSMISESGCKVDLLPSFEMGDQQFMNK